MHAEIKKQTLALSDILDEFEINRLGKLMFRTVVNSFFLKGQTDGRTDRRTDIASDDIRCFFRREKKTLKIYTNLKKSDSHQIGTLSLI